MEYISTRNSKVKISSCEAIKMGLSTDGGLFWPSSMPKVSLNQIQDMASWDYRQRAKYILGQFLTDFTEEEIAYCVDHAYTEEKFASSDIAPVRKIKDGAYALELWHGPTCAFKDMALQILPYFLTTAMKKTKEEHQAVILVATSGDTGKAALEGFCDVEGTKVIVFYPSEGVSEVQKQQMVSQDGDNTFVAAVHGNFDDCQTGVKRIFGNTAVKEKLEQAGYVFSSANSINWGRLAPQIVYYFSAYCDLLAKNEITLGEKVDFVVPTGNFGDILAGYIAKSMGLPVHMLTCASNKNNILTDFIHTGVYDKNRSFYTTMSPSMDILVSSNLERLLFALSEDDVLVNTYMKNLMENGKYIVDDKILIDIQKQFSADFTDEEETTATIRKYYEEYKYVADPHTAVALGVYEKNPSEYKTVILSTASPYKFPASVCKGIAPDKVSEDEWKLFDILEQTSQLPIPKSLSTLKDKAVRFTLQCDSDDMLTAITDFLKV